MMLTSRIKLVDCSHIKAYSHNHMLCILNDMLQIAIEKQVEDAKRWTQKELAFLELQMDIDLAYLEFKSLK